MHDNSQQITAEHILGASEVNIIKGYLKACAKTNESRTSKHKYIK